MAIAPASVAASVLFQTGAGSVIAGGYPVCAALVAAVDATGLIASLQVLPPDGSRAYGANVRHASLASAGEQSWSWPPVAGAVAGAVTTTLMVQSSTPATMPMPFSSGLCIITPTPTGFQFGDSMDEFAFWASTSPRSPAPGPHLLGVLSGSSAPFLLTVTCDDVFAPTPVLVSILGGQ